MRVSTRVDVTTVPSIVQSAMASGRDKGRGRGGRDFVRGRGSFGGGRGSYVGRQIVGDLSLIHI